MPLVLRWPEEFKGRRHIIVRVTYLLGKDWNLLNPDILVAERQMGVRHKEKVVEEFQIRERELEDVGCRHQWPRYWRCRNRGYDR